jgi:glycosyltransferase involved in cell wall biosynthesis
VPALSVSIIARNEAARIAACIESVRELAHDIVVIDSGSTDGTQALCARLGARVIEADWAGYGAQKNRAVDAAAHDWVLCLDADERITPALAAAIRRALSSPRAQGYRFRRCNRFLGRDLRHGEGYPDWSLRLFDRRTGRWSEDPVHEKVGVRGRVDTLEGDLRHESAESLERYVAKQNRYSTLAARHAYAQGRRASALQVALSPLVRFVKFYFLRLGFLDGLPGFIHIAIGCYASFLKHAKLRELAARPPRPAARG